MPRYTDFDFGVSRVMGYFHQDWYHDGDNAADVVARQLAASCDEEALALRRDARTLGLLPSPALKVLWYAGAEHMPNIEWLGGAAEWTRTLVRLCDARLSASEVRPCTGADAEDGAACLDAVLDEIDAARFLAPEVRTALTDCARRCTPDLAFRVLLRTMTHAPDASLSRERYRRLEAVGSALRYGEFVVDNAKYLVVRP
ncbi:hypothetical protein [Streptomyces rubradiris]|uniref:CdiI immunity protein domain-containing protein n=1 Tax=Streptomyces rubradiris TaxID=285531 RepID=A0ABQ3RJ42_STRRR|nr:hypothetical protein [Streptomyces rubradiris]GHH08001.1 hypothetical protein GCM10018792_29120 [Streptomyces rubradiris]GHI55881.1 hypothetical protein Srubr_57270 [Streptomyces rubradiris]